MTLKIERLRKITSANKMKNVAQKHKVVLKTAPRGSANAPGHAHAPSPAPREHLSCNYIKNELNNEYTRRSWAKGTPPPLTCTYTPAHAPAPAHPPAPAPAPAPADALAPARLTTSGVRTTAQCSTVHARHNNLRWTETGDSHENLQCVGGCEILRYVYTRHLVPPWDHEPWLRDTSSRECFRRLGTPRDQNQNEAEQLQLYSDT